MSPTQYDTIGASYMRMQRLPIMKLLNHNVQSTVRPLLSIYPNAKVLDLACGAGHFSRCLLDWGAEQVVGVDISPAMIEAAKSASPSPTYPQDKLKYLTGDCALPEVFEGGEFELVIGIWLLNYAATKEEMVDMYRTISKNLKTGGTFVGVTPPPRENPKAHSEQILRTRPVQLGNSSAVRLRDVDNGIYHRVINVFEEGNIQFDNYYLKMSVYEEAAREAGLMGKLDWKATDVPGEEVVNAWDNWGFGFGKEYWESQRTVPHFALLVVEKD